MTFSKAIKLNVSIFCIVALCALYNTNASATSYGVQSAWDNPNANIRNIFQMIKNVIGADKSGSSSNQQISHTKLILS